MCACVGGGFNCAPCCPPNFPSTHISITPSCTTITSHVFPSISLFHASIHRITSSCTTIILHFFPIHQVISSIHPSFHQISCDYHLISSLMCQSSTWHSIFPKSIQKQRCSLPASVPAQHSKRRPSGMVPTSP